jgi:hypothetical protein
MNSTIGKAINALIWLGMRIARLQEAQGSKRDTRWLAEMKAGYEKLLNDGIIEAYTLLGQFMPNLHHLDPDWVRRCIKDMEKEKQEDRWFAFMKGYLFNPNIYNDLYRLMLVHYARAVRLSLQGTFHDERLFQHMGIGYLRGMEELTRDSLFGIVIENRNYEHIKELIRFFWLQRESLVRLIQTDDDNCPEEDKKNIHARILSFWRRIYDELKAERDLTDNDKKILSAAGALSAFISILDEEKTAWIMLSAPYIDLDFNSPLLIESINSLKDKGDPITSAQNAGNIMLRMLDTTTPDHDRKHIKALVYYLFSTNDRECIDIATRICGIYRERNFDFLNC